MIAYRNSNYPFSFLLKKSFRHVDYFVYENISNIQYFLTGTHYIYIKEINKKIMWEYLRTRYDIIDMVESDERSAKFLPHFIFYTCTIIGKKLLGIKDKLCITPFQLHKKIVNYKGKKFRFLETFNFRSH